MAIIGEYKKTSLLNLSLQYRSHVKTIKRWLVEHGVSIRGQGGRGLA